MSEGTVVRSSVELQAPLSTRDQGSVEPQKMEVSTLHHLGFRPFSAGAFLVGEPRVPHQNRFTHLAHVSDSKPPRLEAASFADYTLSPGVFVIRGLCAFSDGVAAFNSTNTFTAERLASAPQLEPAFEHLLRNSKTHESVINTLRVNTITDRDTFVNVFDSGTALKDGASDLGFDLTSGGSPHKREFARVVTAWTTAKIMSETKLQTDAVARAHRVPVTLLPCDWTLSLRSSRRSTEPIFLTSVCPLSLCSKTLQNDLLSIL